jgi:hypothetical protein
MAQVPSQARSYLEGMMPKLQSLFEIFQGA